MAAFLHYLYTSSVQVIASNPIGKWVFNLFSFYTITCEDGEFTWHHFNSASGKSVTGKLDQVGPSEWSALLNNGDKIDLALRNSKMEGTYHHADGRSPYRTIASPSAIVEHWGRMLHAADKYCVPDLINACEDLITQHLDVHNAATVLQIAERA